MTFLRNIRWPQKDVKKRKFYKKFEIKKIVLKSLINNTQFNFNYKMYFSKIFYNITLDSSISRYRTYCMLRFNSKVIFKFFKLSRHSMKYCASYGLLTGFRKSSF